MTILQANLKHFYQRRGLWLWFLMLLGQTPIMFPTYESGRFFGYLIISLFAGLMVLNLQKNVLAKPFSFCMPGHRKVSRKVIMIVGGIVNAALGMVFLAHPDISFPYSLLVSIAGGFVGMAVYLLAIRSVFNGTIQNTASTLRMMFLMMLLVGAGIYYKFLQEMTIAYPLVIIAISYGICWRLWRWLGQDSLARIVCGKVVPEMLDGWNARKMQKIRNEKMKIMSENNTTLTNWLGDFFLSKMKGHNFLSRNRYTWGSLYAVLGAIPVYLKPWMPVTIIAVILYFGYFNQPSLNIGQMMFLIPAIVVGNMKMTAYPSLLLPGGRREMFIGVLTSAFSVTLLTGVALIVLTIISHLIEPFLPPIPIKTESLNYQAMDISKFYLFLMIIPIVLSTALISRRHPILKLIVMIALMEVAVFWGLFSKLLKITITPVTIALVIVVFWLIFVMLAYNFCMKKCLVGQGKG